TEEAGAQTRWHVLVARRNRTCRRAAAVQPRTVAGVSLHVAQAGERIAADVLGLGEPMIADWQQAETNQLLIRVCDHGVCLGIVRAAGPVGATKRARHEER